MTLRLIRQLFAILIATVLIGAPAVQATMTMPCHTVVASATDHQLPSAQAPAPTLCKGTMSACAVMLGCGINAGLPAHITQAAHKLIWIPVAYRALTDAHEGLSIKPDLDPPITI
jgi:hypothetical protein